jgi:hypothetical protein
MCLPSHLLGALSALLGTVGSCGFAFGGAALAAELALEPLGAGVRLHRPLCRRAQLVSQAVVLLAQVVEGVLRALERPLGAVGARLLCSGSFAQGLDLAAEGGGASLGFRECLLGAGARRARFGGRQGVLLPGSVGVLARVVGGARGLLGRICSVGSLDGASQRAVALRDRGGAGALRSLRGSFPGLRTSDGGSKLGLGALAGRIGVLQRGYGLVAVACSGRVRALGVCPDGLCRLHLAPCRPLKL